ncbi:T9SS type A sorting domain-containing protein [Taibaiella koreensis]|uniref:T9SS type A sorting domain-containing protein n=1 Tax=Taibaiella koreensis TaxID=1268548 RepID=UPI000E59DBC8|nr:T9SS type A sorting domain-containing protein [Taibaiella koreensis]
MKKMMLLAACLHSLFLNAQEATPWIKPVSFFGIEDIPAMGYIPGSPIVNAAVWTFEHGVVNAGADTEFHEYKFTGRNAADGTLIFEHRVEGIDINKVVYDASLDQVLVLINIQQFSAATSLTIGPNTFTPPSFDSRCLTIGLLRYSRSGALLGTQWLPFPCSHGLAGALSWDIDTLRERVVLGTEMYGDLNTDFTPFTFGSTTRILRTDSTYLSLFQWDYSGNPLQLSMFEQPFELEDRSRVVDVAYGDKGDVCILGTLVSDIRFGSITLSGTAAERSSFAARLRADGSVAAAQKIFSSVAEYAPPLGLAYNKVNKRFYFANAWSDSWSVNGSVMEHGNLGFKSNILVASVDSNLVQQHFTSVRYADTVGTQLFKLSTFKCLQPDAAGNMLLGVFAIDSFRIKQKLFRSIVTNSQTDIAVVRFDKELQLDTCIRSAGTGIEQLSVIAPGAGDEVYIGGRFIGQLAFPSLEARTDEPEQDAYVVKLSLKKGTPVGIGSRRVAPAGTVYPNPATDKLFVAMEKVTHIALYTIDGRCMRTVACKGAGNQQSIGISDLRPGVYLVRITGQNGDSYSTSFTKK